jgi:phage baseplate assembly protein W
MSQFDRQLDGVRYVSLNNNETLQSLAARTLGSAERWTEIVNINKLIPPYVTGDPLQRAGGRVALYGDLLKVPGSLQYSESADDRELIFERDCLLENGDIQADAGDIKLVSGTKNLVQAIRHKVLTDTGELLFHSTYGCDVRSLLGATSGPIQAMFAASYVKASVKSDPRVQDVKKIQADVVGDQCRVECEFHPIVGRMERLVIDL